MKAAWQYARFGIVCTTLFTAPLVAPFLALPSAQGQVGPTGTTIVDDESGQELVRTSGYIPDEGIGGALRAGGRSDTLGTSPYGPDGQAPEQEPNVVVKDGEIVVCAYCQQMLHYNVEWRTIPVSQARGYHDDGSHGDEVRFDGIPSNIRKIDDTYIGPHCWKNKLRLMAMADLMAFPRTLEKHGYSKKQLIRDQVHPLAPHMFYNDIQVTAMDEESGVTQHFDGMDRIEADISIVKEAYLAPYEGYEWYPDYTMPPEDLAAQRFTPGQDQFQHSRLHQRGPDEAAERRRRGNVAAQRAADHYNR